MTVVHAFMVLKEVVEITVVAEVGELDACLQLLTVGVSTEVHVRLSLMAGVLGQRANQV
jgi:hypothetical protein